MKDSAVKHGKNVTMHKPKIAILHYSCPPVIGGVESIIESHAKLFRKHGYKVRIIAGEGKKFRDDIEFTRIAPAGSQNSQVKEFLADIQKNEKPFNDYVKAISESLSNALDDIDICIAHNVLTMHFNLALSWAVKNVASRQGKTRFVNWVHDFTLFNPDYTAEASKDFYPWNILRTRLDNFKYIAISELRKQQIRRLYGIPSGEISVIPDGIDITSFLKLEPFAANLFMEEDLPNRHIVAFTPTRILRRKNLEAGIELVKSIKKKGKSIKWMISGAPDPHNAETVEYFRSLQEKIRKYELKDDIVFLSDKYKKHLSDEEINSIYRISDVLFFMSRQEGFGIPVLEAALSGLLVVASDIPPLIALGRKEAVYISLKHEDLDKKAGEIISCLESSKRYRLFKRTVKTFIWESIFREKIEPLVHELTAG